MTEQEVIARLRARVQEAGSLRAFAKQHGVTASYIHDILHERRAVSERIAAAIGIKRVVTVTYEYHDSEKNDEIPASWRDDRISGALGEW